MVPFLIASLFLKKNDTGLTSPMFIVLLVLLTFFCFFGAFTFPILPMLPFWLTHFTSLQELKEVGLIPLLIGLVFVMALVFLAIRFNLPETIKKLRSNTTYKDAYIFMSSFFVLAVIYSLINAFLKEATYIEVGIATRNYAAPFLGFIVLFLPRSEAEEKIQLRTIIASVVLIILISVRGYQNKELYTSASKINLGFRSLIEESLQDSDYAVFFPASAFISKDLFLLFSDYRYGERRVMFEDQVDGLPFRLDPKLKSMRILNSRHFGSPIDASSKFSYWYINKLLSLKYLPDIHRGILEDNKFYFKNKDICNEPYESFNHGDTFSLFVPDGLKYWHPSSDGPPDKARNFIDKLTNAWQDKCGFEVLGSKAKFFKNKKIYILEIDTKPSIKG